MFRISPSGPWISSRSTTASRTAAKLFDDAHLLVTDYRDGLMLLDIERAEAAVEPWPWSLIASSLLQGQNRAIVMSGVSEGA
jgi:hypothetical protein